MYVKTPNEYTEVIKDALLKVLLSKDEAILDKSFGILLRRLDDLYWTKKHDIENKGSDQVDIHQDFNEQ